MAALPCCPIGLLLPFLRIQTGAVWVACDKHWVRKDAVGILDIHMRIIT